MFTLTKSRLVGGSALLAAMALAIGAAVAPAADDQATAANNEVRVGTYDPETVFQQYHGLGELIALSQRLQGEFQQAQMEGNQARLMQLQQEMQEGQMRVITQFQNDVEQAVPQIAREHNLKIVAVEITYIAPEYGEPQDITQEVARKVNEDAPQHEGTDPFAPTPPAPAPQQP